MIGQIILWATSIISAAVAVAAVVQSRRKPKLDRANEEQITETVKEIAARTNRKRDVRIWQLEGYVDLDRSWHREIIVILEQLVDQLRDEFRKTGRELPEIAIPTPPEVPKPPDD